MEIEISGLGFDFVALAIGLAAMGYFVGKGLQNFGRPEASIQYNMFIEENQFMEWISSREKYN